MKLTVLRFLLPALAGLSPLAGLVAAQGTPCEPSWLATFGAQPGTEQIVRALTVFDDGSGPALHASASFPVFGGPLMGSIARLDGSEWSPLAGATSGSILALAVFGDALCAGGSFARSPSGDSHLGRLPRCPDVVAPVLSCPEELLVYDRLASPPGELVSFSVPAVDNLDPAPSVVCTPPSGSFFPRGTTQVTCTATDAAGNQATCEFSVTVVTKTRRR